MAISTVSFGTTPQAADDLFLASATGLTEDALGIVWLAVMDNDKGGAAKALWSLDDGTSDGGIRPEDLLTQDVARSEALSADTSAAGARIWITSDGRVGYDAATLNPDFLQQLQQLNAGEVLTDSFTYAIRLGNGTLSWATAVIQFAGLNDAPVVTGTVLGNAVEDGAALTLDALANASDVDRGSVLQVVDVPATLPPGVSYDAATHSFTLDPAHAAYQHLPANQTVPVTVLYGVSDGTATTPASVTFTVTGTNDAAQIGEASATAVQEDTAVGADGMLSASGTLAISDVDDGEAGFQTAVEGATGNLGSLALGVDGSYTYSVANADVQFLAAHKVHEDHFTVRAIDGTSKVLTFTVEGVNDAAVITGPDHASVTEDTGAVDGQLVASGTLGITDVDAGEASFQPGAAAHDGNLGSLTLAADGSYTYTVSNAAVQILGADDSHIDTFTVTASDGTTQEVKFTIHGTNDLASIAGTATGSVQEDTGVVDGRLTTGGVLTVADIDAGQAAFQAQASVAGTYGTFALAADGAWTYSVANDLDAVQALNTGFSITDSFTAWSLDGSASQAVTVTIRGLDDVTALTGGTGANGYSFDATRSGQSTISDAGGTDTITFTGDNLALAALNFERAGNDLQIQVNGQSVTVLNHYGATANAMEQVTFAPGQTFAGYTLAGTYKIYAGADFGASNGNSNDVVAGTSLADVPVDGGGGASGNDLLFGNAGDDVLAGNRGNDLLVGGAGNDRLEGGDGNDVLVGGAGNDVFVFNTALGAANVDHVWDFQASATDTILLSKAVFSGLATAGSAGGTALQAGEFFSGANAAGATVGAGVHILFDSSTGNLYYDADGGGAAGRTLFATLDLPGLTGTVDAGDFRVGL